MLENRDQCHTCTRIACQRLQCLHRLQPHSSVWIVFSGMRQSRQYILAVLSRKHLDRIDADAGIGRILNGLKQQPAHRCLLDRPGNLTLPGLIHNNPHSVVARRLNVPYASDRGIKQAHLACAIPGKPACKTAALHPPSRRKSDKEQEGHHGDAARPYWKRNLKCLRPAQPSPQRFSRAFRVQRLAQFLPASRQQLERNIFLLGIERAMPRLFPRQGARAERTLLQMKLKCLFFGEIQLTVQIQREVLLSLSAVHTKSPKPARIFWVARNRQFLAASSVTPKASPIDRNRIPWKCRISNTNRSRGVNCAKTSWIRFPTSALIKRRCGSTSARSSGTNCRRSSSPDAVSTEGASSLRTFRLRIWSKHKLATIR